MTRFFLFFLLTLVLATPAVAQEDTLDVAQDDTLNVARNDTLPVFIVTAYQCDWAVLDTLVAHDRERALPILQDLVDEGELLEAGEAVHQWGDDYNLITWLAAPDIPSALEAWQEMTVRYQEAYPDDSLFIESCPKHRDYFYTQQTLTQANLPAAEEAGTPADEAATPPDAVTPTLVVSYFTCDYTRLGDLIEESHTRYQPIAQALVDEGTLGSQGIYTHAWGDEWNLIITRTAEDLPALLGAIETYNERYEAQHGESTQSLLQEHCSAHKDNIYTVVMYAN